MKKITTGEACVEVARSLDLDDGIVREIVTAFLALVVDELVAGEEIVIRYLGTFHAVQRRSSSDGPNTIAFQVSRGIKDRLRAAR